MTASATITCGYCAAELDDSTALYLAANADYCCGACLAAGKDEDDG